MALANLPLQVEQASDWSQSFVFGTGDSSGNPNPANATWYNLTGTVSIAFSVNETDDPSSAVLVALTLGAGIALYSGTIQGYPPTPAAPNGFTLTLTAAQTKAMPIGTYYYDCAVMAGTGLVSYYLKGSFQVVATVARP